MSGNKKHGYRRGNASGRRKSILDADWFCDGCRKTHRHQVERNGNGGKSFCNRTYWRDVRDAKTGELKA
jgi:hypothetical protein